MENQKVQDALKTLVGEELKSVSYKWLARHFRIPVNLAKQHLFAFSEEHRSKVHTTYFLAGWTKDGEKKHTFQLVEGKRLQDCKQNFDLVTSLHVHSVQPSQPKDPSDLWNADHQQLLDLYTAMVEQGEENCLAANTISAVTCTDAKRDSAVAKRISAPAATPAAPLPKPGGLAARLDGIVAGATGAKKGVASASIALESKDATAETMAAPGPASAPAAAKGKPGKNTENGAKGGVKDMFKKAPAKKRKKAESSESQEDAAGATQKGSRQPSAKVEPEPKAEAGPKKPKLAAGFESDSESDEMLQLQGSRKRGKPSTKRPTKKARASLVEDSDSGMEDSPPLEPEEETPARPVKRAAKAGREAAKQQRTVTHINDKGEEVTEVVLEAAEDSSRQQGSADATALPEPHTEPPAAAQKAPPARKPSPPRPAAKKSAKSKPAGAGQKSLTSFFKKK